MKFAHEAFQTSVYFSSALERVKIGGGSFLRKLVWLFLASDISGKHVTTPFGGGEEKSEKKKLILWVHRSPSHFAKAFRRS